MEQQKFCKWGNIDNDLYKTQCKQEIEILGTLKENEIKYCFYCGKIIKEIKKSFN